MAVKLLVADDHEIIRSGLKAMLSGSEIRVAAEADSSDRVVSQAARTQFDLVLLDVQLPPADGLVALSQLRTARPNLPVLMFSAFSNPVHVARAVALGACGYLLKTLDRARLIEAVLRAANGELLWTRSDQRRVTGSLATPRMPADIEAPLTHREFEVLRQLASGKTNKEIAITLKISYETVKEHVQHVLRKIGVSDRTQAAVWAVRRGLIE